MPDGKNILYLTQETLPKPEKEKKERDKKLKFDPTVVDKENFYQQFFQSKTYQRMRVFHCCGMFLKKQQIQHKNKYSF